MSNWSAEVQMINWMMKTWKLINKQKKLLCLFAKPFTWLHWGLNSASWHLDVNVICSAILAASRETLLNCSPYKSNLFCHKDQYFITVCKLRGGKIVFIISQWNIKAVISLFLNSMGHWMLFISFLLQAFLTLWRTKKEWLAHCLWTVFQSPCS